MSRPLRVLITRPRPQVSRLAERLDAEGYESQVLPLLEIKPLVQSNPIKLAPLVIFVSVNAVRLALPQLEKADVGLSDKKLMAIGPATASALTEAGYAAALADSGFCSEDLLALLEQQLSAGKALQPLAATIVCGVGGRDFLEKGLEAMGFEVNRVEVYRRQAAPGAIEKLQTLDAGDQPDLLSLMNKESLVLLAGYLDKLGLSHWFHIPVLAASGRIADQARLLGFRQVYCQSDPTESALMKSLSEFSPT